MAKINARAKGHAFERKLMNLFRELGWEGCKTSRNESKSMDDKGVDLCGTEPFYIQAKAVEKLGSYHTVLDKMPKEAGKINLLWHKKNNQGSIVSMGEDDFLELLKLMIEKEIVKPT